MWRSSFHLHDLLKALAFLPTLANHYASEGRRKCFHLSPQWVLGWRFSLQKQNCIIISWITHCTLGKADMTEHSVLSTVLCFDCEQFLFFFNNPRGRTRKRVSATYEGLSHKSWVAYARGFATHISRSLTFAFVPEDFQSKRETSRSLCSVHLCWFLTRTLQNACWDDYN